MAKPKKIDRNAFAKTFFKSIVENFGIDEDKAYGRGIEFNFLPYGILLIHHAGLSNKAYVLGLKALMERAQTEKLDDDQQHQLMAKLYADTIVVGLMTPDKEPIPYDDEAKQLCAEALADKGMSAIFERLKQTAMAEAYFRREREEKNAKNSSRSSSSSTSGDPT